jgi:hypothetical protein
LTKPVIQRPSSLLKNQETLGIPSRCSIGVTALRT